MNYIAFVLFLFSSQLFAYDDVRVAKNNPNLLKDFSFIENYQLKNKSTIAIIGDYAFTKEINSILVNENEIPDNFIDDDNNGYIDDYLGIDFNYLHGRFYTPFASGHENGIISIVDSLIKHFQIDDKLKILPINITTEKEVFDDLYIKKLANAIDYARIRKVQVISMSLGISNAYKSFFRFIDNNYDKSFKYLQDAIDRANTDGIIILGAVSNDNLRDHIEDPTVPANSNGVIAVANVDYDGVIQSGYGKNVDMAYYGTDIFVWSGPGYEYVTEYELTKGSSLATPLVALSMAILKSLKPDVKYSKELMLNLHKSCDRKIESKRNIISKCIYSPESFIQKNL